MDSNKLEVFLRAADNGSFIKTAQELMYTQSGITHMMNTLEDGSMEFNQDSLKETWGYAEPSLAKAEPGERFQFFRKGYYIADTKLTTDTEKVFNSIVSLKSSWKK